MWILNETLKFGRTKVQLEQLANAARFIIFNGEMRVITLKAAGTGRALESMEKVAPIIQEMLELEGYRVTVGPLEERIMTKTGINYKSIKISVYENQDSIPLPDGVAKVEDLTNFEYKKASDTIFNTHNKDELVEKIRFTLKPLCKKWNQHLRDPLNTTTSISGLADQFPRVARFLTYFSIEDDDISGLLTEFMVSLRIFEFVDIEWSPHVMRDKFDKPLKVFLVRFKRRVTTTN